MVGHVQGKLQLGTLCCQVPALQVVLNLDQLPSPAAGPVGQQPLHQHLWDALSIWQLL